MEKTRNWFSSHMGLFKRGFAALVLASFGVVASGCTTNPATGRSQMILLPEAQVASMGAQAYQQIKTQQKISRDPKYTRPVVEISQRIVNLPDVKRYYGNRQWEVTVFEDDTPNAFALPGGKIGVHTGLFKVAKNRSQLAAVIGHEVAHVIGRHSAERVSQGMLAQVGVGVAGAAYGGNVANLLAQAATLGVILPFSRSQESEADVLGLKYMAQAGYDPRQSVNLWQNFKAYGGSRPPEFLSTHPSPDNRIARLQQNMPAAMEEYNRSPYRR